MYRAYIYIFIEREREDITWSCGDTNFIYGALIFKERQTSQYYAQAAQAHVSRKKADDQFMKAC